MTRPATGHPISPELLQFAPPSVLLNAPAPVPWRLAILSGSNKKDIRRQICFRSIRLQTITPRLAGNSKNDLQSVLGGALVRFGRSEG
jgi:hypothetical protein